MKKLKLTEDQFNKIRIMCEDIYPDYEFTFNAKTGIITGSVLLHRESTNWRVPEYESFKIHWYEFLFVHIVCKIMVFVNKKLLMDHYNNPVEYIFTVYHLNLDAIRRMDFGK